MNEFTPKVSIIIPVYNGANYLREAIDSALAQTYENVEVIVVNDGSTDDGATEHIALNYGDKIRYFYKENGGVATALNFGINVMQGDYFSWLSHDDVYYPNKLEAQINHLRKDLRDVILYADYDCIDANSKFLHVEKITHITPESLRYQLIEKHPINGCTALIPKKCFAEVGFFDTELRVIQDYDMWFRLSEKFKFIHIPEINLHSRLHQSQGSVTMADSHFEEKNSFFIRYFKAIAPDAPADSLLKTAIILKRASFFEAAQRGYELAIGKYSGKYKFVLQNILLIINYHLSKSKLSPYYWINKFKGAF